MKLYPILCLAGMTVFIASRVGAGEPPRPTPSPALLTSAWAHLTQQVGAAFATKYLTFDENDPGSVQYFGEIPPETSPVVKGEGTRHTVPRIGSKLPVWRFDFRFSDPKKSWLNEGIRPWTISFHWYHSQDGRFVWAISNTLSEGGECEASGEAVLIDANTGAVFNRSLWSRIC